MNDSENSLIDNIYMEPNIIYVKDETNYISDFNKAIVDYERRRSTRVNQQLLTIKIDKIIEQFKEYEKQRVYRLYNFL